jgi:SAM-dependent methyltransferase
MTAPYATGYADLYDLFYADKPYEEESAFLQGLLREAGVADVGRILELACGTGEHATRLATMGYRVTATDGSAAMTDLARAKAARRGVSLELAVCDMRSPPRPEAPFDAALCLFDSIGYLQTDEAIAAMLEAVGDRLRSGGAFIFEFWHAPAMRNGFDPVRVRRFRRDGSELLRISETKLEPA